MAEVIGVPQAAHGTVEDANTTEDTNTVGDTNTDSLENADIPLEILFWEYPLEGNWQVSRFMSLEQKLK